MNYTKHYYDESGRQAKNNVTNAPDFWVPADSIDLPKGDHFCWVQYIGNRGYQARCSCGSRFGVHRYPLAILGAQRDAAAHRMSYGVSSFQINELDGIDYKLNELAWS